MAPGSAVPLEDVVLAQAFECEALLNVLERRGVLRRTEVLEEIKRLRKTAARAKPYKSARAAPSE